MGNKVSALLSLINCPKTLRDFFEGETITAVCIIPGSSLTLCPCQPYCTGAELLIHGHVVTTDINNVIFRSTVSRSLGSGQTVFPTLSLKGNETRQLNNVLQNGHNSS